MPAPDAVRAGRSIGAMFFAAFGAAWLTLWALSEFSAPGLPLAAIGTGAVALLVTAIRVFRYNRPALAKLAGTAQERRRSKLFNVINGAQWGLIALVAVLLARNGRQDYIVPAIIVVVGLHFLPLAALFSYRPHFVTGLALTLWPVLYVTQAGPASSLGPLGAGVVLWCSAAWALKPAGSSAERVA